MLLLKRGKEAEFFSEDVRMALRFAFAEARLESRISFQKKCGWPCVPKRNFKVVILKRKNERSAVSGRSLFYFPGNVSRLCRLTL